MASPIIGAASKIAKNYARKTAEGLTGTIKDQFLSGVAGATRMYENISSANKKVDDIAKELKKEKEQAKRERAREKRENDKVTQAFLSYSEQNATHLKSAVDSLKKLVALETELLKQNSEDSSDSKERDEKNEKENKKKEKSDKGLVSKLFGIGKSIVGGVTRTGIAGLLGAIGLGGLVLGNVSAAGQQRRQRRIFTGATGVRPVSGAEIERSKTQLVADIKLQSQNIKSQKTLEKIEKSNISIARSTRYLSNTKQFEVRRVKRKRPEEMTTAEYVKSAENQTALNLDKITEGVIKGVLSDKVLDFYGGRRGVTERQASKRGYAGRELGEILDLREGSSKLGERLFGKKYGRRYAREFNKLGQVYLQAFTEKTADSVFSAFGGSQQENRTLLSQVIGNYAKGNKKLAKEQLIYKFTGIPTGLESLSQVLGFGGTTGAVNYLADVGGSIVGDISKSVLGVNLFGEDKARAKVNKPDGDLTHVKSIKGAMMVHVVNPSQISGDGSVVSSDSFTPQGLMKTAITGFGNKQMQQREGIKQNNRDLEQTRQTDQLESIESTSQSNTQEITETQQKGTFAILGGLRQLGSNIFHSITSVFSRMRIGGGGGGFQIPGMFDTGNAFLNMGTQIATAYGINQLTKGIKDPTVRAAVQIGGQYAANKYLMPKLFNSAGGQMMTNAFGSLGTGFKAGLQGGSFANFAGASTSYNIGVGLGKVAPYTASIIALAKGDVKTAAFSAIGTKIGMTYGGPVGAAIGSVIGSFVGGLFGKKKKKPHIRSDYVIVLDGNNDPNTAQEVFRHNRQNLYGEDMVQKVSDLSRRLTIAAFNAAKVIESTTGQASIGTHIYVMVDEITFKKVGSVQIKFLNEPNYKGERRFLQGSLGTPDASKLEFGVKDRIIDKSLPYYATKIVGFVKEAYKKGKGATEQSKVESAISEKLKNVNTESLTTGLVTSLTQGETRLNPNLSKGIYGATGSADVQMQNMLETLKANRPKGGGVHNKMIYSMKEGKYIEAPFTYQKVAGAYGMTTTQKKYDASVIGVDEQGNLIRNVEGAYTFGSTGAFGQRTPTSVIDMSDIIAHTQTNPLVVDAPSGDQSFLAPSEPPATNVITDNSVQTNQPVTVINNNISSYDTIRYADSNA